MNTILNEQLSENINDSKIKPIDLLENSVYIMHLDTSFQNLVGYRFLQSSYIRCISTEESNYIKVKLPNYKLKLSNMFMLKSTDMATPIIELSLNCSQKLIHEFNCHWAIYERANCVNTQQSKTISMLSVFGDPVSVYNQLYLIEQIQPIFVYLGTNIKGINGEVANEYSNNLFNAIESGNSLRRPFIICKGCDLEWDGYEKQNGWGDDNLSLWSNKCIKRIHDGVPKPSKRFDTRFKFGKNNI
jgi:hypothetical protein